MTRAKITARRSPYYSNHVDDASFTVGVEGGNAINVAIQLKMPTGGDLNSRGHVKAWLSSDVNGDTLLPLALMPTGGYAIGTDGTIHPGPAPANRLMVKGALAIDAVAEKFKTTAIATYSINGANLTKAATTAIVFSAAHTITASKFGVVLIQINAAGTVSTKVPLTPQAYNTAALALAALPDPDAGNVALGYIQIQNNAGDWVANTDDLTNGSDLTTAAFVDAAESGASYPPTFDLVSEADGDIDITFSETLVRNPFYLNVELADGKVKTSGAITFA